MFNKKKEFKEIPKIHRAVQAVSFKMFLFSTLVAPVFLELGKRSTKGRKSINGWSNRKELTLWSWTTISEALV